MQWSKKEFKAVRMCFKSSNEKLKKVTSNFLLPSRRNTVSKIRSDALRWNISNRNSKKILAARKTLGYFDVFSFQNFSGFMFLETQDAPN